MPRTKLLVSALALALAGTSVAQAQSFSDVVVFGDSLSDAGNVAAVDGNPATPLGSSFTTNPDPVYAQIVANAFGFSGSNSVAGGSNYAFGGACARANVVGGFTCVNSPGSFSLTTQLGGYLAAHAGHADPDALYMMWGGANDIFTAAGNPATAQQNTGIAAATMVGLIGTLQNAGAETIVVFNMPDLGLTPNFVGTAGQASASGLAFVYNSTFNAGLANLADGIVPINVNALINEIVAQPSLYGFTNVTGMACGGGSSVACGATGDPAYPFHYAAGANSTYLFADSVHPTGAAHAMLANVVLSTLTAPGQVSMAGELPLQVFANHGHVINKEIFVGHAREAGDGAIYGNLQFGQQDFEATENTNAFDNDLFTATFGADIRSSEAFSFGAAISFGGSDGDTLGANIENKEVLLSAYGAAHFGLGYVDAIITGGSANLDIERSIELGPTTRVEVGNTSATHTGAELGAGLVFGGDTLSHGPFISYTWQKVDVDGYAEDGLSGTALYFSDFNRKSTIGRIGYQIMGHAGNLHPYGRVAFAQDSQERLTRVQAGSNTMNGHFTLDGFPGARDWIEADVGLDYYVNDTTAVTVAYRGRLSDDSQDMSSFNLGFRKEFGSAPAPAPEPVAVEVAQTTCTDLDDDGDGVNNCDDKCPGSAAGEAVGADGCPVPAAEPEPVMEAKPFRN